MSKTICTRYIPATDTKGARVRASAEGVRSIFISYWAADDAHLEAALTLARKYGWSGTLVRGSLPDGRGDCFVSINGQRVEI